MPTLIRSHRQLNVHKKAMAAADAVFRLTKQFPREEVYSLTDQIRRSSRSITGSIAEAWRKRRYPNAFVSKLNDAESEAAETQNWIEHAVRCDYVPRTEARTLYREYEAIIGMLVRMQRTCDDWCVLT